MTEEEALAHADEVLRDLAAETRPIPVTIAGVAAGDDEHESVGTAWGAALSSFCFFASGAVIPVLPYLFGLQGLAALVIACVLVAIALSITGAVTGLLSGGPPLRRAGRQLLIGFGAAGATYLLGLLFNTQAG
jgi:VIT1/CCC1 family predicted Fe2+/Mn2+ transporter